MASMSTYAILGCGSVGHAVAESLVAEEKDVLILDRDQGRVEALRDQDLNARVGDISNPEAVETVIDRDVLLVLSSDVDANRAAVENIREHGTDHFIVVRASDPVTADELTELGVDTVINPSAVIADSALRALETGELEYKAEQLARVIGATDQQMAIQTHRSPDPDSIASAIALKAIAEARGADADILYDGEIGHQENRAFVNLFGIDLVSLSEVGLDSYDTLALVDHAKASAPAVDESVDIFIDHFEPETEYDTTFTDVRPNVSSTSTILTKYIQELDLKVDQEVATALLYGIRAETLDVLAEAIRNRDVKGSHLVSNAGFIRNREALSEAAQHLLNLEGITTTAVFAIADETIYLAARSKDIRMDIGSVLTDALGDSGDVVGHSTDATVEIPLGIFTGIETTEENRETLLSLVREAVKTKLFAAMGVESSSGESTNGA